MKITILMAANVVAGLICLLFLSLFLDPDGGE